MTRDWLLDYVSPVSVLACDDPAEMLARHARFHGERALESFTGWYLRPPPHEPDAEPDDVEAFRRYLAEPSRAAIDARLAGDYARRAWRFALAAVALERALDPYGAARAAGVIVREATDAEQRAALDAALAARNENGPARE